MSIQEGASAPVVEVVRDVVADSRARFEEATADHTMIVRRDDGLYRHLKFGKPGTSVYSFDLITWPGYLAVVGDCGDFLFSRVADMFEFFEGTLINPEYWSEKLQAPAPDAARKYSERVFRQRVGEWLEETASEIDPEQVAGLRDAVADQLLDGYRYPGNSEHEAHEALRDFSFGDAPEDIRIYDSWEWDMREFDFRFVFCCWAIVWGIAKYSEAASTPAADAASQEALS